MTARSNWLADQVDIRGWGHRLDPGNADEIVRMGRGAFILLFLTPPSDAKKETLDAYWSWVEERILNPIKEQFPSLYQWLVHWHRGRVAEMADADLLEGDGL